MYHMHRHTACSEEGEVVEEDNGRAILGKRRKQIAIIQWPYRMQPGLDGQVYMVGPDAKTMQAEINKMLDDVAGIPGVDDVSDPVMMPGANATLCMIPFWQMVPPGTPSIGYQNLPKPEEPKMAPVVDLAARRKPRPDAG